jgi:hypothetical protein
MDEGLESEASYNSYEILVLKIWTIHVALSLSNLSNRFSSFFYLNVDTYGSWPRSPDNYFVILL